MSTGAKPYRRFRARAGSGSDGDLDALRELNRRPRERAARNGAASVKAPPRTPGRRRRAGRRAARPAAAPAAARGPAVVVAARAGPRGLGVAHRPVPGRRPAGLGPGRLPGAAQRGERRQLKGDQVGASRALRPPGRPARHAHQHADPRVGRAPGRDPEPRRHHPHHAHRPEPRADQVPVHPARFPREPGAPGRPEDQRRLLLRRPGRDDPRRGAAHRPADQPPDGGQLPGLPQAGELAGRRHGEQPDLGGGLLLPGRPARDLPSRRHHPQRDAGAGLRAGAQVRQRPPARRAPAGAHERAQGQGPVPRQPLRGPLARGRRRAGPHDGPRHDRPDQARLAAGPPVPEARRPDGAARRRPDDRGHLATSSASRMPTRRPSGGSWRPSRRGRSVLRRLGRQADLLVGHVPDRVRVAVRRIVGHEGRVVRRRVVVGLDHPAEPLAAGGVDDN